MAQSSRQSRTKKNTKPPESDSHKPRAYKEHAKCGQTPSAFWTAAATVVIAIFTIVLAAASIYQGITIARTDETTRSALVDVQRALIVADELQIIPMPKDAAAPDYWLVSPIFENGGSTTTKEMAFFPGIVWFDKSPLPSNLIVDTIDPDVSDLRFEERKRFPAALGPRARIPVYTYIITKDDALRMATSNDNFRVYILGQAKYNDAFEGTPQHTTKFCFRLFGTIGGNNGLTSIFGFSHVTLKTVPGLSYRACFHNNCTDKECKE